MDTLDSAADLIREQLRKLDAERARLENALRSLTDHDGSSAKRSRKRAGPRKAPAKRAKRGQRREQLLAALKKNPGSTPSELAREVGTSPSQVSTLLRKARQEKLVSKRGSKYSLKG